MFQRVLQPMWFQPVSFMRALQWPDSSHSCQWPRTADVRAHLVVQVKQVWGKTCLVFPLHQVAAAWQIQICLDLSCVRSHLDKTTTWHDPRVSQLQSAAAQHPISGTPVHAHSLSNPAPTTQPQNNINPETGITLTPPPPFIIQFLFRAQTCFSKFCSTGSGTSLCWVWFLRDSLLVSTSTGFGFPWLWWEVSHF